MHVWPLSIAVSLYAVIGVVYGCQTSIAADLAAQHYVFFSDARPQCRLVLPAKAELREREAAELIRDTFRDMGGGKATIVNEPATATNGIDIYVGATDFAKNAASPPTGLDQDGFVIHPVSSDQLVLLGGRPTSTFYAATEFLERYAGVLWVWPGKNGTVIPKADRFEATVQRQVSEPAFASRIFSGIEDTKPAYYRIHSMAVGDARDSFHHAIHRVLTPDLYTTHPEYFSMANGKRQKPVGDSYWQACTSNPDVVRLFVEAAKRQFRERPWVRSFSVSQNDAGGFCQCDKCRALDMPGVKGVSNRYFTFVNAVADGIRDAYLDKLIACFAYVPEGTANIPARVKLRPNTLIYLVIPTLADCHKNVVQWSKAAPNLGAYFWLHGKTVPKFYPHRWAEYLRFLRSHNVKGVYAEVYQEPGPAHDIRKHCASWALDGPRCWITAKLLWDPDANVDDLMDRFCRQFYGAAHRSMLRYYRQCEAVWERRNDPFDFGIKYNNSEVESYSATDMKVMEDCLRQSLELAKSDVVVTARLKALEDALMPAATYACLTIDGPDARAIGSRADVESVINKVCMYEKFVKRLVHAGRLPTEFARMETAIDDRCCQITQVLGNEAAPFWKTVVTARPELERFAASQLLAIGGNIKNLATNPSFEVQPASAKKGDPKSSGTALSAAGWTQWSTDSTGAVGVADDVGRSGSKSLALTGVKTACGIYVQPVQPGERYRVSCWAKTSMRLRNDSPNRVGGTLTLRWQTADGKWNTEEQVQGDATPSLPLGLTKWTRLVQVATVPATDARRMVVMLGAKGQDPGEKTWFDDLCIEKLSTAVEIQDLIHGTSDR
jgi:hypothetical protein